MSHSAHHRRRCSASGRRAGITVLVVLALVSVALAMSYAILCSQMSAIHLQSNSDRGHQAEQAALAGMSAALRAVRLSNWSGVAAPLNASISATDAYSVTYTAGDASLTPSDPDYAKYPYRLTVTSTGTSVDPAQPTVVATHRVQAVLELVPRKLDPGPANWSTMAAYTIYQMTNTDVFLALPCHIEGPARLASPLRMADAYSWHAGSRSRYFSDLNLMRSGANEVQTVTRSGTSGGTFTLSFNGATTAPIVWSSSTSTVQTRLQSLATIGSGNATVGGSPGSWTVTFGGTLAATDVATLSANIAGLSGPAPAINVATTIPGGPGTADYRPFSGPVSMPTSLTDSTNLGLLTNELGLSVNDIVTNAEAFPSLGSVATYRLYPGGPQYNLAQLPASVSNTTLTPDPVTNPLGLYYASSSSSLGNNVTIRGTVITGVDLNITGTNVLIDPHDLQPLDGTTSAVRLPSVIALDDLTVAGGAQATINGVVCVGDDFVVDEGTEGTSLSVQGRVIASGDITIGCRSEWKNYASGQWDTFYADFQAQLSLPGAVSFFPMWMSAAQGRNYVPNITLRPASDSSVSQWQNLSQPVYAVLEGDSGLHWDLVSWTDRL
ncbi:MAG: hypothetical protein AB7O59_12900 [Pirellulales bacterium]